MDTCIPDEMVERLLVISTGHLTALDCMNTSARILDPDGGLAGLVRPEGFMVYVDEKAQVSEDMAHIFAIAAQEEIEWVMFDEAAAALDEIPIYDW